MCPKTLYNLSQKGTQHPPKLQYIGIIPASSSEKPMPQREGAAFDSTAS